MSSPATAVTSSRSFSSRPRRRAPGSTRIGSGRSSPRSRSRTASPSLHPSASRASRTTKRPTRRTFSAPPTRHSTPRSAPGRTRSPRQVRRRKSHDMAQRDILIVDDDRQVREVLHQILVAAGYNCLLANDGREGVEVFKAGRPQLVVTDLKMPGMTGIERSEEHTSELQSLTNLVCRLLLEKKNTTAQRSLKPADRTPRSNDSTPTAPTPYLSRRC